MAWHTRFYKYKWFEAQADAIRGVDFDDFLVRANSGDAECMVAVGVVHHSRQEYSEAMRYLTLAAERGNTNAMVGVGLLNYEGQGVEEDEACATRWFQLGALKGNDTAMLYMGFQLAHYHARAMSWFRRAAKLGNADAMLMIGYSYMGKDDRNRYEGSQMRDPIEALRWYRMAADAGSAEAMRQLGICYELGEGTARDDVEALRWHIMAASGGNVQAMIFLAFLYDAGFQDERSKSDGEATQRGPEMMSAFWQKLRVTCWASMGSEYDPNKDCYDPESDGFASRWALNWLHRAANKDNDPWSSESYFMIGNIYHRRGDYVRALEWYRKAGERDAFSMIGLGIMYQEGHGVPQDYAEALRLYSKAQENWTGERVGVAEEGAIATVLIGILHGLGRGVPQDVEEARRWLQMESEYQAMPLSSACLATRLYADRFYAEAYCWLVESQPNLLPRELLGYVDRKRVALAARISPLKEREIQARSGSK